MRSEKESGVAPREKEGMNVLYVINMTIFVLFTVFFFYQHIYLIVGSFCKPRRHPKGKDNRFAVLISARNEQEVIGHLIDSIKAQDYPAELVDVYVVADNCTDDTAAVSRAAGAIVYERQDDKRRGKGYALTYLFDKIYAKYGKDYYDGFFVFDADNLLEPNYISSMNRTFSAGYRIVTSYRNSKNYKTNWLSAGYALWFLREAVHLNNARTILGTSCAVSGTGFLFHKEVAKRNGGWKFYLLTEDIEFTVDSVLNGERIGYCHDAVFYDEQPVSFRQAWRQRLRWSRGYLQVFRHYGGRLIKGIFTGCGEKRVNRFACFDMSMTIMPALILSLLGLISHLTLMLHAGLTGNGQLPVLVASMLWLIAFSYVILLLIGIFAGIKERRKIHCPFYRLLGFYFTFPIFIYTYIPITIAAMLKKEVEWKPIRHSVSVSYDQLNAARRADNSPAG